MIYLRTGLPGASKTLNTLREICHDDSLSGREIYYNNIKLLLLDFSVVRSFEGYFYGAFLPLLKPAERVKFDKVLKRIHDDGEMASADSFPHLKSRFESWLESRGHVDLWLYWVRRCYSAKRLKPLEDFLSICETPTDEDLLQFKLDWRHFINPIHWHFLPRQSVIVVDECQQWFPPRPVGSKKPQHVEEFAVHRHKGWDIHLITQDAKLLDSAVRQLVGKHVHYNNPLSSSKVTRQERDKVFDPNDYHERKLTIKKIMSRDTSFYGVYWSADTHTHKMKIPIRLYLLIPVVLIFIGLIWFILGGGLSDLLSGESDSDQRISDTSAVKPLKAQAIVSDSQPINHDYSFYPFDAINQIDNPLRNVCRRITFAGTSTVATSRKVSQSYYLQCIRSDSNLSRQSESHQNAETDNQSVDAQSQQRPAERDAYFLTTTYLSMLGFKLVLVDDVPVLAYENLRFVFPPL